MKLLYCSYKQVYKKDGNYYSTGSFPDFLPSLSKFFEKAYLMVPVSAYTINGVSKLTDAQQLKVVETKTYKNRYLRYIQSYFWSFRNMLRFKELQDKADIVLIGIPSAVTYLAYIPIINKPLIILIAGDEQEVIKALNSPVVKIERFICFSKFRELIEKYLVKKSDAIICRNNRFKEKLIQKYNVPEPKINVITSGVKTNIFKPLTSDEKEKIRQNLKLKNDDFVVGFVATHISYSKGADDLIEAFDKIGKEYLNAKLLLIGYDEIGIPKSDSIIHCGLVKREELSDYYNAMNIFVFPSRSEGAPKVVMEACACGIPVISTKVGGIPDLVKEGYNGFLVNPGDINAIVNHCKMLLNDVELRNIMGKKASEYAVENFDFNDLVKRTADVIKGVVNEHEGKR